jgi:hypothetical protein
MTSDGLGDIFERDFADMCATNISDHVKHAQTMGDQKLHRQCMIENFV